MKNNYSATPPANADPRDVVATALAALPWAPQGTWTDAAGLFWVGSDANTLTGPQLATFQSAVTGTVANPNAPWRAYDTLVNRATAALTVNATFLGLASPSNAQTIAQVQALTKQCNGLIRLLLQQLDSTINT